MPESTNPESPAGCSARWVPAWHQLDQTLSVGDRRWFYFRPADPATGELTFYNGLEVGPDCERREATIESISHPQLGEILRVDTDGLDYIVYPAQGAERVVDAEQAPGTANDGGPAVDDWELHVRLSNVSPPQPPIDL